jgi:hypothetical protein
MKLPGWQVPSTHWPVLVHGLPSSQAMPSSGWSGPMGPPRGALVQSPSLQVSAVQGLESSHWASALQHGSSSWETQAAPRQRFNVHGSPSSQSGGVLQQPSMALFEHVLSGAQLSDVQPSPSSQSPSASQHGKMAWVVHP